MRPSCPGARGLACELRRAGQAQAPSGDQALDFLLFFFLFLSFLAFFSALGAAADSALGAAAGATAGAAGAAGAMAGVTAGATAGATAGETAGTTGVVTVFWAATDRDSKRPAPVSKKAISRVIEDVSIEKRRAYSRTDVAVPASTYVKVSTTGSRHPAPQRPKVSPNSAARSRAASIACSKWSATWDACIAVRAA